MNSVDITAKIIDYLQTNSSLVSLVANRIMSPDFYLKQGAKIDNPKVAIKNIGGEQEIYQRYSFKARADDLQVARQVMFIIKNWLVDEAFGLPGVNLWNVKVNTNIEDTRDDDTKEYEAKCTIDFYFFEA